MRILPLVLLVVGMGWQPGMIAAQTLGARGLTPGYPGYPGYPGIGSGNYPGGYPPVAASRWQLGVAVNNLPYGCQITFVSPGSAAQLAGLTRGDTVLSVSGSPVGYVGGQLYDLADVANSRADATGRVLLTVRSRLTGQVSRLPVQLTAAFNPVQPVPPILPPAIPPIGPPVVQPPIWGGNAVPTIRAWYLEYLGREADAAGINSWLAMMARGGTLSDVRVGILCSTEYYDRCRNNPTLYVQSIFNQVVGRPCTPQELNTWVGLFVRQYRGDRASFCTDILKSQGKY